MGTLGTLVLAILMAGDGTGEEQATPLNLEIFQVEPKKQKKPKYPYEAIATETEGNCAIRVWVDPKGRVTDTAVEDCPVVFQTSCLEAAGKSSFYPYKLDGERVRTTFVLRYEFVMKPEREERRRGQEDD